MAPSCHTIVVILGAIQLFSPIAVCDVSNVVSMNFTHKLGHGRARKNLVSSNVINYEPQFNYFLTANIGNPPQTNELLLDTGSSDTYVLVPGHCRDLRFAICEGGVYDKSKSSTYTKLPKMGRFHTSFGTSAIGGSWFADAFRFGQITVKDFIMGLGTDNRGQTTGLVGLGFSSFETGFHGRYKYGPYPNLPVKLKRDGHIRSKSFSIFLDDAAAQSGKILFGGYDSAKFHGELKMLPYLKTYKNYPIQEYALPFTSVGINRGGGATVDMKSFGVKAAILDSGTPSIVLHQALYDYVLDKLPNTTEFRYNKYHMDCSIGKLKGSVDFGFGEGKDRVIIPVPIAELVNPAYNPGGKRRRDRHGKYVCESALELSRSREHVFMGRQFFRSAYLLFDLENKAGGIAPAKRDPKHSNLLEYHPHGPNHRINRSGMHANPATMTRTKDFVATVQPNPAKDTHYTKRYSSLGPLHHHQKSASQLAVPATGTAMPTP